MPALVTISPSIFPFFQGFLLVAGTIISLGPQNMFIIHQGLRRQHLFATAFFSALARVILIALAVGGLSASIATNNHFRIGITAAGALFLIYIGVKALIRACCKGTRSPALVSQQTATSGIGATIIAALCFAFLNPAIYTNTLMVIGTTSLTFSDYERLAFAIGAILAAIAWFFTLSYGASKLTPVFQTRRAWRMLDGLSGFAMLGIASTLVTALVPML